MQLKHLDVGFEVKTVDDNGTFTGYGSIFGVVDSYYDVVAPGAFTDSLQALAAQNKKPAMLWQHRSAEPIGVYPVMKEDGVVLYLEGKLTMQVARAVEAHALLKDGAISGLSIGFVTREDSYDRATGIRTLKRVDLWEVSLVTFPANDAARITGVKAQLAEIQSIRDAEAWLRDAASL